MSRAQPVIGLALQVTEPGLCLENSVEQKRPDQICVLERSQCGEWMRAERGTYKVIAIWHGRELVALFRVKAVGMQGNG